MYMNEKDAGELLNAQWLANNFKVLNMYSIRLPKKKINEILL